jgi:hypothetical protein
MQVFEPEVGRLEPDLSGFQHLSVSASQLLAGVPF